MTLFEILQEDNINPVFKARTGGGEYAAPCPACGGEDRFRIWPSQDKWWCRQCERSGDAIQYLRDFRGLSFPDAKEYIDVTSCTTGIQYNSPKNNHRHSSNPTPGNDIDIKRWRARAEEFVDRAHNNLLQDEQNLKWLEVERGLRLSTIREQRLGVNSHRMFEDCALWGIQPRNQNSKICVPSGLVIPVYRAGTINGIKCRDSNRDPKYLKIRGGENSCMVLKGHNPGRFIIVVESELDAILLHQECGDVFTIIGMGSAYTKPDTGCERILNNAAVIIQSFDVDANNAGVKQAVKWLEKYPNSKRWPCLEGKDPTEYFLRGGNLRQWAQASILQNISRNELEFYDGVHDLEVPFPQEVYEQYTEEQLERLAIQSIDGGMDDHVLFSGVADQVITTTVCGAVG